MFLFNAQLSLNFATRDASLVAAEEGVRPEADCLILAKVDQDLNAPTDETRVLTVHIFSATETGGQLSTPTEQTYTRIPGGGVSTSCDNSPTPSLTSHYAIGTSGYPPSGRCSDLDRTSCSGVTTTLNPLNTGVDIVGVQIDYRYQYVTPLLGGGAFQMTVRNAMRMEPIL